MLNGNIVRNMNLVLSGGGIRGIAYAGAYEVAEKKGYNFVNIAGVSAGAIAGSVIGAGYRADEFKSLIGSFDYEKIKVDEIPNRVPVVARYIEFSKQYRYTHDNLARLFFSQQLNYFDDKRHGAGYVGSRTSIIKNVVTYSKEGCLFDGDYLEEWIYGILKNKGIRTFGDLKSGLADEVNPSGYKVRVLAVDATREKVIVLPDDSVFYGINPDSLEVAKAVRMSASVPFAFKPVELKKQEGDTIRVYNIVDGGVLDNFPLWMIGSTNYLPTIGFRLEGGEGKKIFSLNTPLNILKFLISSVHDIGIPKANNNKNKYTAKINTAKVASLDFDLSEEEKVYLYNSGRHAALFLFNNIESKSKMFKRYRRNFFNFPYKW
jgi:NTE family protein